MPQHLPDLGERCALAEHLGRQRVPQQMRAFEGWIKSRAIESAANDAANRNRTRKSAVRGSRADEHLPAGAHGTRLLQVIGQCGTDIVRDRQALGIGIASPNVQFSRLSVEILQCQTDYFTRAQAQPGEQQQNRPIAPPDRCVPIAVGQQALNLIR